MNMKTSVILIEFNELTPSLMHRFIGKGKLPNFQRLCNESHVFVTDAEEKSPYLEPWIQWVTVHSGLSRADHHILHLSEGHKLQQQCIWDLLSAVGFRVWICGSMNVRYDSPLNGYILPDPWTAAAAPYPDSLLPYFKFIRANVIEHTNERIPLSHVEYFKFMKFMLSHGLSVSTVRAIVRQIVSETTGKHRWKRAIILDNLQFDLFKNVFKKVNPQFSVFFSNSTAHFQHMYWRSMEPDLFKEQPTWQEKAEFEGAILFGYREMDKLIGRLFELIDESTTLIFCTALSQQPCLKYEDQGGKSFYRPRDFASLLNIAGITTCLTVSPVMSEQFHLYFENEQDASEAEQRLLVLRIEGRNAMTVHRDGTAIFGGCAVFEKLPPDAILSIGDSGRAMPFFDIFYKVEGVKSGMHHPDGMLWVRKPDRKHCVHKEKVPLTSIAPTILDMFSVPLPNHMRREFLKF